MWQVAPLIRQLVEAGNNSMAVFCAIPDLTLYVVHDNITDLSLLHGFICSGMVDFTAVQDELMTLNSDLPAALNVVS